MRIVGLIFENITALDLIGPTQVLGSHPDTEIIYVSPDGSPARDPSSGALLSAQGSIVNIDSADVLLIPGGFGTRKLIEEPRVIEWVREIHEGTTWTASICTGSLLLGAAGLLDGLDATTHWYSGPMLERYGAHYVNDRVVCHPEHRLIMAAGVSAGIDMGLDLAGRIWDRATAESIQLAIEYDPQPPFQSGSLETAPAGVIEALRARYNARDKR